MPATKYYLLRLFTALAFSIAWENSRHLAGDVTTGFPAKWCLRNERRNSILMTRDYPDLGSASDRLNQTTHASRPFPSFSLSPPLFSPPPPSSLFWPFRPNSHFFALGCGHMCCRRFEVERNKVMNGDVLPQLIPVFLSCPTLGHLHDDVIFLLRPEPLGFCFLVQIKAFVI